jgi:hypothetical protein
MSPIELSKSKEPSHAEGWIRSVGEWVWWVGAICAFAGKIWKKLEADSYHDALLRGAYNVTKQVRSDHAAASKLYSLLILVGVVLTLVGCVFLLIAYILKRRRIAACSNQAG